MVPVEDPCRTLELADEVEARAGEPMDLLQVGRVGAAVALKDAVGVKNLGTDLIRPTRLTILESRELNFLRKSSWKRLIDAESIVVSV